MLENLHEGKLRAQRTWGSSPTGWTAAGGAEPGTREFFERALHYRSTHEQPWLPDVVPFAAMSGQRVLEIGFGPGYDALACLQNGADYRGIDITPENVERTRKHLAFYGYEPQVELGDAEDLPFENERFDIVFSNGVLHHTPDIMKAFTQAHRVLRKGGSFFVILYHRNSIFYRLSSALSALASRRPLGERLRHVEANAAGEMPIVNVYSRRDVSNMLAAAQFSVRSIKVRKLTWEDMPMSGRKLNPLYRRIPRSVYATVGRAFGWYVIGHGVK